MPSFTLTDLARDLWVESFALTSADLGLTAPPTWAVTKRTLRGGRRDGVDLIRVQSGALAFSIVPTRGMGLWKAHYKGDPVGWRSPIADGPVHPAFVNLTARGGLGWLQGFDELLARCGLESNGAPYREGDTLHTLHGRIANIPAHFVAIHVDDAPPHAVTVEGHVDEAELFFTQIRMVSRISTVPGTNRLTVRDAFTNLRDSPGAMQMLYHWNFGPPQMEEGARLVAPVKTLCPRNADAAAGIGHYATYGPPAPGTPEQVFFFELHGDGPDARTVAMLRNRAGDKAVALRFSTKQLPCFILWKNQSGPKEGYVTALEPATNYPNPRPFEEQRGRVVRLEPGETFVTETTLEVIDTKPGVAALEAEIDALQRRGAPTILDKPTEPFAAGT